MKTHTKSWGEKREQRPEDVITERADGSSDGLPEDQMLQHEDWNRECFSRNPDLQVAGALDDILPKIEELTAEQLVEAFNQAKEQLFPGKTNLTGKEELEVYKRMRK